MKTVSASDAKSHFGELLDTAIAEPVAVKRGKREVAVVLSWAQYERLKALEEAEINRQSRAAENGPFLSAEESREVFDRLMREVKPAPSDSSS